MGNINEYISIPNSESVLTRQQLKSLVVRRKITSCSVRIGADLEKE